MEKIRITETVREDIRDQLDSYPIAVGIKTLQEIWDTHSLTYSDLTISFNSYYGDDRAVEITGTRWETDLELASRIRRKREAETKKIADRERRAKEKQQLTNAQERALYIKLHDKYKDTL